MFDDGDQSNPFEADAEQAAQLTDSQLAGTQARLTTFTWDELQKMLPSPMDQKQLTELMNIVQAATDHNVKVASLIANISTLGSVVVKVLSKVG